MNSSPRALLIETAKKDSENKTWNLLAYFYPVIKELGRKELFEYLMKKYDDSIRNLDEIDLKSNDFNYLEFKNKDYRIKNILVSNLKGIPSVDENGRAFGINFQDKKKTESAIILANNGAGKSSIFSGLELLFSQEVSEIKLRSKNNNLKFEDFYKSVKRFNSKDNPNCTIETLSGQYTLENKPFNRNEIEKLGIKNSFISDNDIFEFGKIDFSGDDNNEHSLHSIIAKNLGLSELLKLKDVISSLSNYRRTSEGSKVKNLTQEIEKVKKEINTLSEQIAKLEKDKINNKDDNQAKLIEVEKSLQKLQTFPFTRDGYNKNKEDFLSSFDKFSSNEISPKSKSERSFLITGEDFLESSSDCPFCQNSNLSISEIKKNIQERIQAIDQTIKGVKSLEENFSAIKEEIQTFIGFVREFQKHITKEEQLIIGLGFTELENLNKDFTIGFAPIINDEELFPYVFEALDSKDLDFNQFTTFLKGAVINELPEYITRLGQILKYREDLLKELRVNNLIENLDTPNKEQLNQTKKNLEKRLLILEEDYSSSYQKLLTVQGIKKDLDELNQSFNSSVAKVVKDSFEPAKQTVEGTINKYFQNSNLKFKIDFKEIYNENNPEESKSIIIGYVTNTDGVTIEPDKFFNTFRYKLLSLMIKLSLTLASRVKYKINLPLIIDDIFSGADFTSKNSFSKFIESTVQIFKAGVPDLDFQIILFTHDEVIFRNAMDALAIKAPEDTDTKVGRLYPPDEKEEKYSTLDNSIEYWNLLYEIPKELSF